MDTFLPAKSINAVQIPARMSLKFCHNLNRHRTRYSGECDRSICSDSSKAHLLVRSGCCDWDEPEDWGASKLWWTSRRILRCQKQVHSFGSWKDGGSHKVKMKTFLASPD
ncbi:hypothetical protein AVEN_5794-1 [Araneus ventricosus]|uniref:Uncharacterized protein n=1 Tax=Araneus ventricosus TaxID=182803 RepID=A0A4Y2KAG7_ARAVE|nr:hypothetical protein AVEN_5794-1 [Araneus ventricosus]